MTKNYGQKQVVITYWHNGTQYSKTVDAARIELTVKVLRECGASGIKVLKGKTKKHAI